MAQCVFNINSLLVLRDTIHLLTQGHGAGEFPPDNLPCIPRALSLHGPGGGLYAQGMCPRAGQATTRCNINNVLIQQLSSLQDLHCVRLQFQPCTEQRPGGGR